MSFDEFLFISSETPLVVGNGLLLVDCGAEALLIGTIPFMLLEELSKSVKTGFGYLGRMYRDKNIIRGCYANKEIHVT